MSGPAERPAAAPEHFVGVWDLESWSITLADGRVVLPFGPEPVGMIAYTPAGTVHAHFARGDRERLGLPFDRIQALRRQLLGLEPATEEFDLPELQRRFLRAALEFNGYCATFEVAGREVRHRVVTAVIPEWEGHLLVRSYAFEGDRLILSTDSPSQQDRLIWRRRGPGKAID